VFCKSQEDGGAWVEAGAGHDELLEQVVTDMMDGTDALVDLSADGLLESLLCVGGDPIDTNSQTSGLASRAGALYRLCNTFEPVTPPPKVSRHPGAPKSNKKRPRGTLEEFGKEEVASVLNPTTGTHKQRKERVEELFAGAKNLMTQISQARETVKKELKIDRVHAVVKRHQPFLNDWPMLICDPEIKVREQAISTMKKLRLQLLRA